jgi:hypothetical protein
MENVKGNKNFNELLDQEIQYWSRLAKLKLCYDMQIIGINFSLNEDNNIDDGLMCTYIDRFHSNVEQFIYKKD